MADIVHEHTVERPVRTGNGMGFILGIILLLILLYVLFTFGAPILRSVTSGPSVQIPSQVDVNVNNPGTR
jgi:hypothetical protein